MSKKVCEQKRGGHFFQITEQYIEQWRNGQVNRGKSVLGKQYKYKDVVIIGQHVEKNRLIVSQYYSYRND